MERPTNKRHSRDAGSGAEITQEVTHENRVLPASHHRRRDGRRLVCVQVAGEGNTATSSPYSSY